jgi:ribonuclease P protein component
VQELGARVSNREYVVLALPNAGSAARLGVTVSSKVANAVGRNRVKRWVREAFRVVAVELPPVDLVFIARSGATGAGRAGAERALAEARARLAAARGAT